MTVDVHGLVDLSAVRLGALVTRGERVFGRSVESPPLVDVADNATADVDGLDTVTSEERTVVVDTPVGAFEAASLTWQWLGPTHPTIVYHHGGGERPFENGRLGLNTFRRLFVEAERSVPANVVAIRAPYHDRPTREYLRAMGDLENFVGMVAAAVGLVEAVIDYLVDRTDAPVVVSGVSLGGFVTTLHRARFDTADRYVPILAGAALGELFVSAAYRRLTARSARRRPTRLRATLDFETAFTEVETENCAPLLARYDRIVEYDAQRPTYRGIPVSVMNRGHLTGALATGALRRFILDALPAPEEETPEAANADDPASSRRETSE
jgi:alpha-beta hydrolase superfamily lysophospholipase